MSKLKVHTIYKNSEGTPVPGVTTILNNLGWNKNALIAWARNEALKGKDPLKIKDRAADIGTITHYLINCHHLNQEPVLDDYSKNDIDKAENAFLGYLEWEKENNIKILETEISLVSEKNQYGGTIDCIANINNIITLLDYKTNKDGSVYPEYKIQVSAYKHLWDEIYKKTKIKRCIILCLNKDNGNFSPHYLQDLDEAFEVFLSLRKIHNLREKI